MPSTPGRGLNTTSNYRVEAVDEGGEGRPKGSILSDDQRAHVVADIQSAILVTLTLLCSKQELEGTCSSRLSGRWDDVGWAKDIAHKVASSRCRTQDENVRPVGGREGYPAL